MHRATLIAAKNFYECYPLPSEPRILDLAGLEYDDTLRKMAPKGSHYVSADRAYGPSVQVVIEDSARFPFYEKDFHAVLWVNRLEHDPAFWESFLEILRILKQGGLLFLSACTNGYYSRSPLDNWRLYPDAPKSMETWARSRGVDVTLVESFIMQQQGDEPWNELIAVFQKADSSGELIQPVLFDKLEGATNIWVKGENFPRKESKWTEDMQRLRVKAYRQRRQMPTAASATVTSVVPPVSFLSWQQNEFCIICGGCSFNQGPSGRMSVTGKPPHCSGCESLERHRIIYHLLQKLPAGFLDRRSALSIGTHPGMRQSWFKYFEKTQYRSGRSTTTQTDELPECSFDLICFDYLMEFLPDANEAFSELWRLSTPDSLLVGSFANPMQRLGTRDYMLPKGNYALRRLFGMDIPEYFKLAAIKVHMLVVDDVDPNTGVREPVHFFTKDTTTFNFLRRWFMQWDDVKILQTYE